MGANFAERQFVGGNNREDQIEQLEQLRKSANGSELLMWACVAAAFGFFFGALIGGEEGAKFMTGCFALLALAICFRLWHTALSPEQLKEVAAFDWNTDSRRVLQLAIEKRGRIRSVDLARALDRHLDAESRAQAAEEGVKSQRILARLRRSTTPTRYS